MTDSVFPYIRCVSVPSEVRLFYGAGCVKKRTADGTDTQRMHGNTLKKNSGSESYPFAAQLTCSDSTFRGNTTLGLS